MPNTIVKMLWKKYETFEYFEELDEVLGCKPNIIPNHLAECAFDQDKDSPHSTSHDSNSPQLVQDDNDTDPDNESERILTKKPARQKQPSKGKHQSRKKQRPLGLISLILCSFCKKAS